VSRVLRELRGPLCSPKVSWALVGFSSAEAARRAVTGYGGLRGRY
jgi:hypothetical protein